MKKCLFTKSTENLNTVVTITTDIGPVTVYLSDEVLDKTLKEVSTELTSLIANAKNLAETFGFDLMDAIAKGGMMSMGGQQPVIQHPVYQAPQESFRQSVQQPIQQPIQQPARPRNTGAPIVLRNQEIPIKNNLQAAMAKKNPGQQTTRQQRPPQTQIVENEIGASGAMLNDYIDMDNPYHDDNSTISESISKSLINQVVVDKKQVLQRVQTPTGRVFDIPASISDANGTTEITINTKNSAAEFEKKRKRIDEASKAGQVISTNGYNEKTCPFCKGKQRINGEVCPKCNGEGSVIL